MRNETYKNMVKEMLINNAYSFLDDKIDKAGADYYEFSWSEVIGLQANTKGCSCNIKIVVNTYCDEKAFFINCSVHDGEILYGDIYNDISEIIWSSDNPNCLKEIKDYINK